MLNRREFNKRAILIMAAAGAGVTVAGCNVIKDIEDWVPVGITAFKGIESVLAANGFALTPAQQLIANATLAALTDLQMACAEYLATTPPPVGTAQKVETFLRDVVNNFSGFLQSLNLPVGSLLDLIAGLVMVVLSTLAGFQNELMAKLGTKVQFVGGTAQIGEHMAAGMLSIKPQQRTHKQFVKDWNGCCQTRAKELKIQPTVYLKLHWYEHLY